jgi:hypothetical protein
MNYLYSGLQLVVFKVKFYVRCLDATGSKTIILNKRYFVSEIGLNGWYKIKGETGRYVWHNPKRFKKLIK